MPARGGSTLFATCLLGAAAPSSEGERLALDDPRLVHELPPEVAAVREALFGRGATLLVAPAARRFAPALPYLVATGRFASHVRLGDEGRLEGFVAGQPFTVDAIDCAGDPEAGRSSTRGCIVHPLRRVLWRPDLEPARALRASTWVPEDFTAAVPASAAGSRWRCLGEARTLAAIARPRATPSREPLEDPLDDLRFELRPGFVLEAIPSGDAPPYARRLQVLDRETLRPLYTITLADDGAPLRAALHAWQWSGDDPGRDAGWEGVPAVRALLPYRTLVVHVETGARKRIDFLDADATPLPSRGRIRRLIVPRPGPLD